MIEQAHFVLELKEPHLLGSDFGISSPCLTPFPQIAGKA